MTVISPELGAVASPVEGAAARPTFEEAYEQLFDFVWRSLRRLGVPAASIDDAVQDVFVVIHRRLADFEGRSALKTWAFGIALRVAGDFVARAGTRPSMRASPTVRPGPSSASTAPRRFGSSIGSSARWTRTSGRSSCWSRSSSSARRRPRPRSAST